MDVAVLIVNSIASLAAVIGVIITCCQFRKTMNAQERAINISLLDARIKILEYFEKEEKSKRDPWLRLSEKTDYTVEKFRLLFSQAIVSIYDEIEDLQNKKKELYYRRERDKEKEFSQKEGEHEETGYGKMESLKEFIALEKQIEDNNANEYQIAKFKAICSSSTFLNEHYYNSILKSGEIEKFIKEKMGQLLKEMREEIESSVSDKRKKK